MHNSPMGGHSGYLKTLHRVKQDFYWQGMKSDIKNHIKCCEVCQRPRVTLPNLLAYCSLFQYLIDLGWILAWILLKACLNHMDMMLFWWWLIDSPGLCISFLSIIHSLLPKLLLSSSRESLSYMACPSQLSLIGGLFLLRLFGNSCLSYRAQSWLCLQLPIPKLMGKLKLLIEAWSSI